tara:strand:+ start:638 stop:1486 length:849 start_codon:yes stop_codon:yes gene_type:complete
VSVFRKKKFFNDLRYLRDDIIVDVSIIMPCFNSANYLDKAVYSVINQTFQDWELLICDDGSSDGSIKLAKAWAKRHEKIFFYHNKFEKGAAGARNTCLSHARGRYIAFLDSDDIWLPQKIDSQLRFMADTNASFVFGYCENMSQRGVARSVTKAPAAVSLKKLFISNFIPCLTVIYDSAVLGKVEQPYIERRNDFALWLKILAANPGLEARCYPRVIARYRVNSYGLSAKKISSIWYFYRCLREYGGLGSPAACFFTLSGVMFKILKTVNPWAHNILVSKVL